MSDREASSSRARPKARAEKKREAPEEAPASAAQPALKQARADASESASDAGIPDKYNIACMPSFQVADWKLGNFEVYGNLCAGGTKKENAITIRTPPALVLKASLHGLGEKGFKQERDSSANKLCVEMVYGDLPARVLAKHPQLEQEHQHFIAYIKEIIEVAKTLFTEDGKVRPGVYKKIKADLKAEGYVGEALKAEARERFFYHHEPILKLGFEFFEKDGKLMMSLPLDAKAMNVNKDEHNPALFQQPGPEVQDPLRTYLMLVGDYAEYKKNAVRYFDLNSNRLFETEIHQDPFYQVVRRGDICSVDMNIRVYSASPKDNKPNYWAIKGALCPEMVRVYPRVEDDDKEAAAYKLDVERILDTFACPPPEEDAYADGW